MKIFPYMPSKCLTMCHVATLTGTLFLAAIPAAAQTRYTSTPKGSDVKIEGTSSLHDWEMEGTLIGGFLEFGAGVQLDPAQANIVGITGDKVPATGRVIIPVRSVHSKADHMPDVMDHLMQDALKEPQAPRIEFTLKELAFKGPHEVSRSPLISRSQAISQSREQPTPPRSRLPSNKSMPTTSKSAARPR